MALLIQISLSPCFHGLPTDFPSEGWSWLI